MSRTTEHSGSSPAEHAPGDGHGSGIPIIRLRGLSKDFGGEHALSGVDLDVRPAEVLGLLGQNGSGKSTLIKILAGYHAPSPGAELEINGERVRLPLQPGRFRDLGLSFVHQDLALIPSLSVAENLFVGRLARSRSLRISWGAERRRAAAILARHHVAIDPAARVSEIGQVERALLAIVRAVEELRADRPVGDRPGLLVLDEATAFLPRQGVAQLFSLVREIVSRGDGVLFVSHDLDEVLEVTDRVTVLRDGRVVGTVSTREATREMLIELIIGRRLETLNTTHETPSGQILASVRGLSSEVLKEVSFDLHRGEILGLTGLLGAGFEEIPYLLFGARRARAGTLRLGGRLLELTAISPVEAVQAGISLVPGDRQGDGSIGVLSVADNVSIQVLDRYRRWSILDRQAVFRDSALVLRKFQVRPPLPGLEYQALSGGNQQKVLLAKWLQSGPSLLLLDEPTVGVDVGTRQQIFRLLREAAAAGTSILCASADHEQLAVLCDRVLIVARGRVVRQLEGSGLSRERITEQCLTGGEGLV